MKQEPHSWNSWPTSNKANVQWKIRIVFYANLINYTNRVTLFGWYWTKTCISDPAMNTTTTEAERCLQNVSEC